MFCAICNHDTATCTCKDLESRMDAATSLVYKRCRTCMKHYTRCKCETPEWFASSGGKEINMKLP